MRIHILHNPKILRFDCLTVRFLCNKNLTERGILLSRYLIFFSLSSSTCSRIVRTARVIFGSHVFLFFSFLFFFNTTEVTAQTTALRCKFTFIFHRAPSATCDACGCSRADTIPRYKGTNYFRTNYFRKQVAPCNTIRTHKLSAPIDNAVEKFRGPN